MNHLDFTLNIVPNGKKFMGNIYYNHKIIHFMAKSSIITTIKNAKNWAKNNNGYIRIVTIYLP